MEVAGWTTHLPTPQSPPNPARVQTSFAHLRRPRPSQSACISHTQTQTRCLNAAAAAAQVTPSSQHQPLTTRRSLIKDAKPFSDFLTDTFHRQHDYLRISVTERCNLRCLYCMPEEGVPLSPTKELLTTPEIVLLSSVFVSQGVTKIRLTGGEPTVRRDIVPLMHQIGALRPHGLRELCLTTNGLSIHRKLDSMVEAGLTGVNLSLDTLDPHMFQIMTRRNGFDAVKKSIDRIFALNKAGAGIKFKINCVVMRGRNDAEIAPFVEMTREKDVEVRFIEYMPFDGNKWNKGKMLGYAEMLDVIRETYPTLAKVEDHKNDTSKTWHVPGFAGKIGFITSMTHNFCGTCNRLRITSDGNLKVCLFGNTEVSLRDILRKSNNGEPIDEAALEAMKQIEMDRRQGLADAEKPLGAALNEAELLDVIGMAVKRKKEKHAGIGELEHMKNRPMILIGG
ncbi:molybdenum cofactor biosynthesis protein A [Colletotrichum phormii]|uniref:GTP 3',8-cyclase n=1 Tax=Colletotrichum phormii TaxID=359342 RepID=A0AAI9ZXU8_9PEZI|nr:molybdenum cofactor biosynthesis protein A [Colletotrichum phormii]KAK1640168.1 molybdenum cofactor biosynthesis protein A [Colletotrichum phormii]